MERIAAAGKLEIHRASTLIFLHLKYTLATPNTRYKSNTAKQVKKKKIEVEKLRKMD